MDAKDMTPRKFRKQHPFHEYSKDEYDERWRCKNCGAEYRITTVWGKHTYYLIDGYRKCVVKC